MNTAFQVLFQGAAQKSFIQVQVGLFSVATSWMSGLFEFQTSHLGYTGADPQVMQLKNKLILKCCALEYNQIVYGFPPKIRRNTWARPRDVSLPLSLFLSLTGVSLPRYFDVCIYIYSEN